MNFSKQFSFSIILSIFLSSVSLSSAEEKTETAQEMTKAVAEKTKDTPETSNRVAIQTNKGLIVVELFTDKAPISVSNFLKYVDDGFFNETLFHRVIPGFMIQGGGFTTGMKKKATRAPIKNEANNKLGNQRGTLAMARTNNPNSAKAQFFINLKDNTFLNYSAKNPGYAVFGKVVEGMEVVDAIAQVKTSRSGHYGDVPVEDVIIEKAARK